MPEEAVETQKCRICGEVKLLTDFYDCNGMKNGKSSYCKKCHNEMGRARYKANKEAYRLASKEYRERTKDHKAEIGKEYYLKNKEKFQEWSKNYREKNRDKVLADKKKWSAEHKTCPWIKKQRRWRELGVELTREGYAQLFEDQEGKCLICGKHQSEFSRPLSVDHDHNTGRIRGLLCAKCNTGLGMFNDNIENIKAAIEYLEDK